jgi:hypothetical protein
VTTQERLREAAKLKSCRTQYDCGMSVSDLMLQAADEMDRWIELLYEASKSK